MREDVRRGKAKTPSIAPPTLEAEVARPMPVPLDLVGNNSAGYRYVMFVGPMLWNRCMRANAKNVARNGMPVLRLVSAKARRETPARRKPVYSSLLLPTLSMSARHTRCRR